MVVICPHNVVEIFGKVSQGTEEKGGTAELCQQLRRRFWAGAGNFTNNS